MFLLLRTVYICVARDSEKMDEGCWTAEEEDKLVMWYTELEGDPNVVEKIIDSFYELGIHKTKIEVRPNPDGNTQHAHCLGKSHCSIVICELEYNGLEFCCLTLSPEFTKNLIFFLSLLDLIMICIFLSYHYPT